ncbi:MAG: aldolase/citrate lyase family protein [Betaproteobacteria bacterium]
MHVPRSKLFLSGDRLDELDAALRAQPDALSIDLEDGVADAGKSAARAQVAALLRQRRLPCQVWVRVNGLHSGQTVADVLALTGAHVDVINLPKVESTADLAVLEHLVAHIEAGLGQTIAVVPTIESARGLRKAARIAAASPRVLALQLGAGDLAATTGMARTGPGMDALRAALSLAAAEAGKAALDSTWPALADVSAFEADAALARSLGFQGKSCLLAEQVAAAHRVFAAPTGSAALHRSAGLHEHSKASRF